MSTQFGSMDFTYDRDLMLRDLRRMGIRDERVLAAMAKVPRELFVRADDLDVAYGDHALGIAEGQTISQPYVVARMTELLQVDSTHHVLEVGTGSGYQAAVLAELAHDVVTVERHAVLADRASALLAELGHVNVKVVAGDASIGYPPDAPYDRILVTAASPGIAPELVRQCAPEGLIVAPVGDQEMQHLVVRYPNGRETRHGAVKFVPLRGRAGFQA
jgi:protein-L-isoaspartate(D-aspartate) O-methyltransferase